MAQSPNIYTVVEMWELLSSKQSLASSFWIERMHSLITSYHPVCVAGRLDSRESGQLVSSFYLIGLLAGIYLQI